MNFFPLTLKFAWNIHEHFHNFVWAVCLVFLLLDTTELVLFFVFFLISVKLQESPPVKNAGIYWDKLSFL